MDSYNSELTIAITNEYYNNRLFQPEDLDAGIWDGTESGKANSVKAFIPSITEEDGKKFIIEDSKLIYVGDNELEVTWLKEINIATIEPVVPSTWDNPRIPKGFSKSTVSGETDVSTGLVIIDNTNQNEFVWVPVPNFNNFVRQEYNKGVSISSSLEETWDGNSTATELDKIYKSVKDNGGFYVARYEAGIDTITSPTTVNHNTVQDGTVKPVSKPERGTWNHAKWGETNDIENPGLGAVTIARSMYNNKYVASNLIYGVEWDATLEFIKTIDSAYYVDATNKGNYTGNLQLTGSNPSYKVNNIYDMAGNDYEYTMEIYGGNVITRGGSFTHLGTTRPPAYRYSEIINTNNQYVSFRIALYLK